MSLHFIRFSSILEFSRKMLLIYLWFFKTKRNETKREGNNNVNRLFSTVDCNFGTIESNQKLLTSPLMLALAHIKSAHTHTHTPRHASHTYVSQQANRLKKSHISYFAWILPSMCERNLLQSKWLWLYLRMPLHTVKMEWSDAINMDRMLVRCWKFIKCRTEGM